MSTTDKAYFVVAHYKHLLKRAEETGHTQFTMHYSELQIILDQLDTERQRADDLNYDLGQLQTNNVEFSRDDLLNQEFQQRLANAEHQLYMKDLAIHNIKASRKAQFRKRLVAEAALSAANEKLKGEQVPVAVIVLSKNWPDTGRKVIDYYIEKIQHLPVGTELFTAPQKPVEVSDSVAMQNVKDIAHCLSDIRRFVEAKFMTVGDLPSPEGLLLSGPEWKHESDAIIEALTRVADFYESQHVLKEIGYEEAYLLSPNNDCPDITHGFKFGWNAYHKAAIEAAGGIVKDGGR